MKTILLVSVILGFHCQAIAQPELTGNPDELRRFLHPNPTTVNITGNAQITAYKDIARVSLLFTTEDRQLARAMEDNQQLRQRLYGEFIAAGISAESIKSSKFSTSPQFGLFGRNPNSFEVVNRLEISVSEEAHLQLLAEAADANREVTFEQIEFEHSMKEEFEERVREQALQDALYQKEFYESRLGLSLKAINCYYAGIRPPRCFRTQTVWQSASSASTLGGSPPCAAISPTFDEIEYATSITVVYRVEISEIDNP